MLGVLAALSVLSALILVGVVFRPTAASRARRSESIARSESPAFAVLGAFPTTAALAGYEQLLVDAQRLGVTLDWDTARHDQSNQGSLALLASARRQLEGAGG